MRKKICVIGEGVKIAHDIARHVDVGDELRGADVVVLANGGDLAAIARSAPSSVVLAVGPDAAERCREIYAGTLFPRARVIGIVDPDRAADVVEAIASERDEEHEVVAMRDGVFTPARARLGRGGIRGLPAS